MGVDRGDARDTSLSIELSDEELAALEGWRKANRVQSLETATRELLRLGLLSEIGRTYRNLKSSSTQEENGA
ncbi:MAG: hypothetical protein AAF415_14000 [Pseudomonadota bacterium]